MRILKIGLAVFLCSGFGLEAALVLSPQYAANYTVTTFATGLNYPTGMAELPDGSFLVGRTLPRTGVSSTQFAYYLGSGEVVRMTDVSQPGVADNAGTVIASGLPGAVTGVMSLANGVIAVSTVVNTVNGNYNFNAADITFLKAGTDPAAAYTALGMVHFSYPSGGAAAALLPTAVSTGGGKFQIYFGLNAQQNDGTPGPDVQVSGLIGGQLPGGSLDSLTVDTTGGNAAVTAIQNLATGIRNSSTPVVDAAGDIYFGDNGYDVIAGDVSSDELNVLTPGGVGIPSFGYPGSYTQVGTGTFVGGAGVPPLTAFYRTDASGSLPAGIASLALSPASFANSCVFAGFHGDYTTGGTANLDDPVLCVNPNGAYSPFIAAGQAGLSHPDSLFTNANSLFVENMFTGNLVAGTGEIDVITAAATPEAATGIPCLAGIAIIIAGLGLIRRNGAHPAAKGNWIVAATVSMKEPQ